MKNFVIFKYTVFATVLTGLVGTTYSYGQQPAEAEGRVIVRNLVLEESGTELLLGFEADVVGRAMNNRQDWRIVPELKNDITGESFTFPAILINGRQKGRHYNRKTRFGNEWLLENQPVSREQVPNRTDIFRKVSIAYHETIPFEDWMADATLVMHEYLTSSKDRKQLFSMEGYGRVRLTPPREYVPQPRVNFIVPVSENKVVTVQSNDLIDFPVGESAIHSGHRRNPEELLRIDRDIKHIIDNPYIEVEEARINGYASPEGRYMLNKRLARERAQAVRDHFVNSYKMPPERIAMNYTPEDWEGFRFLVEGWSGDIDKQKIYDIIDSSDEPDGKEMKLRGLQEWGFIKTEIFPRLRRTEYSIDFRITDFSIEQTRTLIESNPELFSHRELYELARSYDGDPVRRLQVFETILRYFPDDPVAINNYAAALIQYGEIKTAQRWLERVKDHAEAANNTGVINLLNGELETARACFETAKSNGTAEAEHNLRETDMKYNHSLKMEKYKSRTPLAR